MVAENYDRSGREVQRKAGLDRKALIRKISRPGQEARLKRDFVDASNCACALLDDFSRLKKKELAEMDPEEVGNLRGRYVIEFRRLCGKHLEYAGICGLDLRSAETPEYCQAGVIYQSLIDQLDSELRRRSG
ncbi:hypothetical protein CMI37_16190 [Candidatus Pacearchaeota archaeon]|nr:hypothetical protein [Candidatus Pacearchaeota archaeon]|tara:strand:+ start:555 stop:950 length:396 start_codon:yes stop_codon:yes gene_type:complete